ncbi:Retrotransposon gag protein [Popillia japonica]|uniref:Retrotransposon gag protein n=1 Tax=Popillia japonica TaxID=7064 RepID=A0AAW1JCG3_POPJA
MLGNTISEIQDMRDPITPKFTRPPRFNPSKTNPVDFLKDYAVAARANSWNDVLQLCYFVNSLENSAARNFAKRNPNATWSETLKGFKSKFIGPNYEDDLNLRLLNRRQSANESLIEYFYAIIDLCDEIDSEMPEASIMRRLPAGMLPYYRHMINISRPNTLSDYERVVDSISETEREGSLYSTEKLKPQPSHKEHSQDVQELLKNMTQEIKSLVLSEVNSTLRTNQRNYGGYNRANSDNTQGQHSRQHPTSSQFSRSRTTDGRPICYRCNKPGHIAAIINQVILQRIVDKMPGASTTMSRSLLSISIWYLP